MRFHELFLNDVDMFLWSGGVHPDGGPRRCQVSVILCLLPLRQHPSLNLKFIVFARLAVWEGLDLPALAQPQPLLLGSQECNYA